MFAIPLAWSFSGLQKWEGTILKWADGIGVVCYCFSFSILCLMIFSLEMRYYEHSGEGGNYDLV